MAQQGNRNKEKCWGGQIVNRKRKYDNSVEYKSSRRSSRGMVGHCSIRVVQGSLA